MAVRNIVLYSEQSAVLRRKSRPVGAVNRQVKDVIQNLKDTLVHHENGVGLAGPQISVHQRVIVVRLGSKSDGSTDPDPPMALVNPEIVQAGGERKDFDGCLSFPGIYAETVRPHYLVVTGLNEWGKRARWVFEGFDAVVVHHEIDHLDGVLFIDRVERPEDFYTIAFDRRGRSRRGAVAVGLGARAAKTVPVWERGGHSPRL